MMKAISTKRVAVHFIVNSPLTRSDPDAQPSLEATSEIVHAAGVAQTGVSLRRDEIGQASVAGLVECVEHLADQANRHPAENGEVFLQSEVDDAFCEAV